MEHISRNDSIRRTSVQSKTNTKTDKRIENSHDVVLQLSHSIADIEDSDNSQLQSSPEMYSLSFKETQDVVSIAGREIQLTKDYTTGNATFKRGSRGTVIEATSRKDGKLKVKLDNDNIKTFRLIKQCDLQLYERPSTSSSSSTSSSHQIDTASVNIGIFLMLLYITFDAFTSNWQSKLFKKHKVTKMQLMIGINFWSTLLIFTSITSSGEIFDAIVFFQTHHINAFYSLILLCLSSALGQFFIYHTIKTFGPLIFSIIMATRQIFSIVLSCIIFQHTLNDYAILGSIIVFLSIGMRIYYK